MDYVSPQKLVIGAVGENLPALRHLVDRVLTWHEVWRQGVYPDDSPWEGIRLSSDEEEKLRCALDEFLKRFSVNLPFFSPRYAAQMLKDPSIPALLGYVAALLLNPNNHAYEGGPATTEMEMEVIGDLLRFMGFGSGWGHLTSGGSLANMEALWAVRDFRKRGIAVFSRGSHYSWKRIASILRVDGYEEIDVDDHYRIDLNHLEDVLRKRNVIFVMANLGTTGVGAIDPIKEIVALRERYGFHLHVDAAYGGYARSVVLEEGYSVLPESAVPWLEKYVYDQLVALKHVDSVTIDPHKHGLAPYGAGAVLYKDQRLRDVILNTAPYTYHKLDKPNIGMWTLEGSRPGASAAAVWLTHKLIPLYQRGFGEILKETMETAREFSSRLKATSHLVPLTEPDLDILCFYDGAPEGKLSVVNERTEKLYKNFSVENPKAPFIFSKFVIAGQPLKCLFPGHLHDVESVTVMRGVLMKPYLREYAGKSYLTELLSLLGANGGSGR